MGSLGRGSIGNEKKADRGGKGGTGSLPRYLSALFVNDYIILFARQPLQYAWRGLEGLVEFIGDGFVPDVVGMYIVPIYFARIVLKRVAQINKGAVSGAKPVFIAIH